MTKKKKAKKKAKLCGVCKKREAAHTCGDCGAPCCEECIIMIDKGDFCTECISANEEQEEEEEEE